MAEIEQAAAAHLVRLPDEQWAVWRWVGLRGAGFPANDVLKLNDACCAASADQLIDTEEHAEQLRAEALKAVNVALDDLRASGGWGDLGRRKPLLNIIHSLKKGEAARLDAAPAAVVETVAAYEAARVRAEAARGHFAQAFAAALGATSQAIADIAGSDRFREALLWQNRRAFHTAVAALRATSPGAPRSARQRQHEELVAGYLQRYCLKNDTIGFFGPVGWAKLVPYGEAIAVRCGPTLLRSRTVYFEQWAIDALTAALAKTKVLRPWLAPRRLPFFDLRGTMLYWPLKPPVRVSPAQAAVLQACTGERTAREIAADVCRSHPYELRGEAEVYKLLDQLIALGLIVWTLEVPFESHPEQALRRLLARIDEERLRKPALDALDELERLRADVARSADSPEQMDRALGALETTFTRLTGADSTRKAGATYAARTLVYEDCQRDVEVELGPALLEQLGRPLALLLTSARWLTHHMAALSRSAFDELYSDLALQAGSPEVNLVTFWQQAQLRLHNDQAYLADAAIRIFQERWAEVLAIPPGQRRLSYTSAALGPRVAATFAAPGPGWQGARFHSPDVMIAAPSVEAIRQGEYQFVMGELHLAANTLRGTLFVAQHPAPAELFAAHEHDLPDPQVVPITPRNWPEMTSRTRSEFVTARDFRLAFTYDACIPAHPQLLPIGALIVEKGDAGLLVRTRDGRHQFDIIEFFSDILMMDIVNGFRIFGPSSHTPRLTIDRLVVSRESWHFAPASLPFADDKSEPSRFLAARHWARDHDLPRQVFGRTPMERKPFYVDFDSPMLVNMFMKKVRRVSEQNAPDSLVTVTEMCPTIDQIWLPDAAGQHYTSELRIVAVDQVPFQPGRASPENDMCFTENVPAR